MGVAALFRERTLARSAPSSCTPASRATPSTAASAETTTSSASEGRCARGTTTSWPQQSTDAVFETMDGGKQVDDSGDGQTDPIDEVEESKRAAEEGRERFEQLRGDWAEERSAHPQSEASAERSRTDEGNRAGSEARPSTHRIATYARRRSPDRHRCCCLLFLFLVLLIVGIGVGGHHYWPITGQESQEEPTPVPTPTARVAVEVIPMPSPSPLPTPVPSATPTPVTCADPTPIPPPTATSAPTATPTPEWSPQPLSDAWRDWTCGWSRQQVHATLMESLHIFEVGLDGLEDLSKSGACAPP